MPVKDREMKRCGSSTVRNVTAATPIDKKIFIS